MPHATMPVIQPPPLQQQQQQQHRPPSRSYSIPITIPQRDVIKMPSAAAPNSSASRPQNVHLAVNTSPVNQNGSYESDRVLKSGYVQKRTRKTKAWKSIFLVLRPNYLSIYKDQNEAQLRHKISLSDLTTVAFLKDPKQKRQHVFGLFSPSRNYHLEASSQKDATEWVELIRKGARIEEEEEELLLASPGPNTTSSYPGLDKAMLTQKEQRRLHDERVGSSSPELSEASPRVLRSIDHDIESRPHHILEYSGNEFASDADMSDTDFGKSRQRLSKFPSETLAVQHPSTSTELARPSIGMRNASQASGFSPDAITDPERVVWQGYLYLLRSAGGVKQWKDLWVVVRPRNIAIYKNSAEYAPWRILGFETIINVVEIDALSRSKRHCLQIITEEKGYKFCAKGEGELDRCLGACKSLLARRREKGKGVS